MMIDKEHIKTIVNALINIYPRSLRDWQPIIQQVGGEESLVAHIVYLSDLGLVEGEFEFLGTDNEIPWKIDFHKIRINAAGIEYSHKINRVPVGMVL